MRPRNFTLLGIRWACRFGFKSEPATVLTFQRVPSRASPNPILRIESKFELHPSTVLTVRQRRECGTVWPQLTTSIPSLPSREYRMMNSGLKFASRTGTLTATVLRARSLEKCRDVNPTYINNRIVRTIRHGCEYRSRFTMRGATNSVLPAVPLVLA